jgi:hypothetical protein
MKNFINFIKIILVIIMYYLIGSLIAWDLDISHWSWVGRIFYVIFTIWGISKVTED